MKVVVVDDHRDVALAVEFALRALGHEVHIAHDAPTALEAVVAHAPELVLIDIVMPGIDGWELARTIRGLPLAHKPRLVAISGYASCEDRARSAAEGVDAHLATPIHVEDLIRVLETA